MGAGTIKRTIFISGNILGEVLSAIMTNGFECTIVLNGGGFTITYDDYNIRYIEKLRKQKQEEYNEINKKVSELREKYAELKLK